MGFWQFSTGSTGSELGPRGGELESGCLVAGALGHRSTGHARALRGSGLGEAERNLESLGVRKSCSSSGPVQWKSVEISGNLDWSDQKSMEILV